MIHVLCVFYMGFLRVKFCVYCMFMHALLVSSVAKITCYVLSRILSSSTCLLILAFLILYAVHTV